MPTTKRTVKVKKDVEVPLPDIPKIEKDEIMMHMIYTDGNSHYIIGKNMCECVEKARAQAREDGKNFLSPDHMKSWERIYA